MSLQVWLPLMGNMSNKGLQSGSATNHGATSVNTGKLGKCYQLDGTDDYIDTTFTIDSTDYSFCCWAYLNSGGHLMDCRNASAVGDQPMYVSLSTGVQVGNTGTGFAYISYTFTTATWYHIAVVYSATDTKLYVNGQYVGKTTTAKGYNFNTTFPLRIGTRCTGANWINGKVNDVRAYNHALSDKEVAEIAKGLLCHYTFNNFPGFSELKPIDCSGYDLGGKLWGTAIQVTDDSPRYSTAMQNMGPQELLDCTYVANLEQVTISWWANYNGAINANFLTLANDNSSYFGTIWTDQTAFSCSSDCAITQWYIDGQPSASKVVIKTGWHMYTSVGKLFYGHAASAIRMGPVNNLKCFVSDFRIYTTPLTDAQVQELYQTSASIDNFGNTYARELCEDPDAISIANDAPLLLQRNGESVATFTADSASNITANFTIPTQTSQLLNNKSYLANTNVVASFNGSTGAVTYAAPVTSVNGMTGDVPIYDFSSAYAGKVDALWSAYENMNDWQMPPLWIEAVEEGGYIGFACPESPYTPTKAIQYSFDRENWTSTTVAAMQTSYVALPVGKRMYFKSANDTALWSDDTTYTSFAMQTHSDGTGDAVLFDVGGALPSFFGNNDQALMAGAFAGSSVRYAEELVLPALELTTAGCYWGLFKNCVAFNRVPKLPALTLSTECYRDMFAGCSSLITGPALPATTLAEGAYRRMFFSCAALTEAPSIKALSIAAYCCYTMFTGCAALKQPPVILSTTVEAYGCYGMFGNCTSLEAAPELPATTLGANCYRAMFQGCTALWKPSLLPAKVVPENAYYNMYNNTYIVSAPVILGLTLGTSCYRAMFSKCYALTVAPELPAVTLASGCYQNMFQHCTSLKQAPRLPAMTLATECYRGMFLDCQALESIPILPATSLTNSCYRGMFEQCTSLQISTTQTVECSNEYRIPASGTGTVGTDSLTSMFASTAGTFTGTPSINTTYYTNAEIIS